LVIELGHCHTQVTPIVDGYILNHATVLSQFGGAHQEEFLLNKSTFQTSFDQQYTLRQLKEEIGKLNF
jgi:actin-related protein